MGQWDFAMEINANANRRRAVSNQDRQLLVDCLENGDDFIVLAEQLGIHTDTARSVIRVWMEDARVEAKPRGGARNKKVDEMAEEVRRFARENPFTTHGSDTGSAGGESSQQAENSHINYSSALT